MPASDYSQFDGFATPGKERMLTKRATFAKELRAWKMNAPVEKKAGLSATAVGITVEQHEAEGARLSLDLLKLPYMVVTMCVAGVPSEVMLPIIPVSVPATE